ncbi:barstar family protein [Streptomyces sp. NPDC102278]|uniref:barstar family protein n=1 Tax=Streptomyces sp. NPDC102278 TaxID=3366152 RepID=UPI0037F9A2D2
MTEEEPTIRIAPWMHVITTGGFVRLDELLPTSGSVYVARLNGRDMTDEISTFRQFDELLKFPKYFGWNWNAFYDCLRDLQWLSSDHHVLVVDSAENVLSEDGVAREEFFRTLWRAGQRWSYVKRPEGVTLSKLSVVLSCGKESASGLARRLGALQAPPSS